MLEAIHHTAIICSDYQQSKQFYTTVLGLEIIQEVFRAERNSWKLDLALHGKYIIELFSFPAPAPRPSHPEACGLRHLAFEVKDMARAVSMLTNHNIQVEAIRVDEYTGRQFTFFTDPDGLPIELYEQP